VKLPPIPADESDRLATLQRAGILDTPPEPAFDELVSQASKVCGSPIALLSFVGERTLWIKARVGIDLEEIPREVALCAHTINEDHCLEVEDLREDPRFSDLPFVTSPPFLRFYAGVPIRTNQQVAIGTLCVADTVPRVLSSDQLDLLRALARQAATLVELRCMAATVTAQAEEALKAKARLEDERARLRGVLEAATEYAIIGCEGSGAINVFNEGAQRMLGYRAEELFGATPLVFHDADEVAARAKELGIAPGFEVFVVPARRGESETREWTYIRKDGVRIPVSLTVTAMHGDAGQFRGFVGIARDLTAERRAERQRADILIERAGRAAAERALAWLARLHALTVSLAAAATRQQVFDVILCQALSELEGLSGVVAITRADGETLDLVGSVGRPVCPNEPMSFPITSPRPVADAVRTGTTVFVEELEPGGRYGPLLHGWLAGSKSLVAAPLLVAGEARPLGAYCLAFAEPRSFRDEDRVFLLALGRVCAQALERVRLFEAEARARGEAETANRLKDEFLSSLSHELRTPLTSVVGWAHILQQTDPGSERMRRGLAVIERNAALQLRLIDDLLDISRIVAGNLELDLAPIDLAALVQGAIDAARPAAHTAGVHLAVALDPAVGPVRADADRLQQAVSNLLSNALKFTPRGGQIEVRVDRTDGWARLRVTDTGVGIDPAFLPFLFDRFRQADSSRTRSHSGLGLGLAIVKHVVESHGGTITAESAGVGRGATFTMLLPQRSPAQPPR
jgi:PAS domain S-box-containing protein